MYYSIGQSGTLTSAYHDSWQYDLDSKGFPKGDAGHMIENLSIVNGGPYPSVDSTIVDLSINVCNNNPLLPFWLQTLVVSPINLNLDLHVNRDKGPGDVVSRMSATIRKHRPWFPRDTVVTLFDSGYDPVHVAPSWPVHFDDVYS